VLPEQHHQRQRLQHRPRRSTASLLLICTNTMHRMAAEIAAAVDVPLLHIADATAARVKAAGVRRVGLLGTHGQSTRRIAGAAIARSANKGKIKAVLATMLCGATT
jgi:aspartate/glutamate racemase